MHAASTAPELAAEDARTNVEHGSAAGPSMHPAPPAPPAPIPGLERDAWMLDSAIDFLNHGSFGARLRVVIEAQDRYRREFEARPIEFLGRRRGELLERSKTALAPFLGVQPCDFGFVTNATAGINAVLRSMSFSPGDELLTTDHVYNAVRMTMQHVAERSGAKVIEAPVPVPLRSLDQVMQAVIGAMTAHTRIVVIDHVTSPTGLIFPVAEIIRQCSARGVDVLVDGAHAPGMLDMTIGSLGAAYYAGNLHKWTCAPPGAAFIWVRSDRQQGIQPPIISHFRRDGFEQAFSWQGTRDISPMLAVRDSLEALDRIGWERIRRHNHQMAVWVQAMLCERWNVEPISPLDGSMLGSMATVRLPDGARRHGTFEQFQAMLYDQHRIEVPVVDWGGRWWVRPCCQAYNTADQYVRLASAVLALCA